MYIYRIIAVTDCRIGEPSQLDAEESLIAGILWVVDAKEVAGYTKSRVPHWKVPNNIGPAPSSQIDSSV